MKYYTGLTEYQPDKHGTVKNIRRINFIRNKIKDHNTDR